MPEGPSIVILKDATKIFKRKKIQAVSGNTRIDKERLLHKTITDIKSWGKHYLVCFPGFFLRIHFLLFGSYRINEKKETMPRLSLQFINGELNFYACSIQLIDKDPDEIYDWTADVLNKKWDAGKARIKLKSRPRELVCDVLLDQDIFAGIGNIIKNEVLFRIKVHPESRVGNLPPAQMKLLLREAVNYSFDFLKWKKAFVLKKHWLAHTKKICPRCNIPFIKKHTGKTKRRSFFCNNCQVLYK